MKPCSITADRFLLETEQHGTFKGKQTLTLCGLSGDKKQGKINLSNPYLRVPDDGVWAIPENPADPLCIVKLYKLYSAKFLDPGYQGRFFLYPLSEKAHKCKSSNFPDGHPVPIGNPAMKVGKNQFGKVIKGIYQRCGMQHADVATSRSLRRGTITALRKNQVQANEVNAFSRHMNASTNELYQERDQDTRDARLRAHLIVSGNTAPVSNYVFIVVLN